MLTFCFDMVLREFYRIHIFVRHRMIPVNEFVVDSFEVCSAH